MLDKKSDAVLELLARKTNGGYKVLDKRQLIGELPARLGVDVRNLPGIIAFLKDNEYVEVKYQDKEEICLCTTVKAESYVQGDKDMSQKARISVGQAVPLLLGVFAAAFLGALLAVMAGKLLP